MSDYGVRPEEKAMFDVALRKSPESLEAEQCENKEWNGPVVETPCRSVPVKRQLNVAEYRFVRALKKSKNSYVSDELARLRREYAYKQELADVLETSTRHLMGKEIKGSRSRIEQLSKHLRKGLTGTMKEDLVILYCLLPGLSEEDCTLVSYEEYEDLINC
eukprot:scaffold102515_cov63-Attheya_sp.AAC.9